MFLFDFFSLYQQKYNKKKTITLMHQLKNIFYKKSPLKFMIEVNFFRSKTCLQTEKNTQILEKLIKLGFVWKIKVELNIIVIGYSL